MSKNLPIILIFFFTIISCEKRPEIKQLNAIFLNMKLEKNPKEFMSDSKLPFEEQSVPPLTNEGKTFTIYSVKLAKNPYFESKINKLIISIDAKEWGKYFITQGIEFDNPEDIKKEAQKLDQMMLTMAEKSRESELKYSGIMHRNTKKLYYKLKKEYGSGYLEIESDSLFKTLKITYTNNQKMDFVGNR